MKVKKLIPIPLSLILMIAFCIPVCAEDYSNEDEWYKKCTQVQTTQEGVTACQGFQAYQKEKRESLNASISSFGDSIAALTSDAQEMEALALEQKELAESLAQDIALQESAIASTQDNIAKTQVQIDEKQAEIDAWDTQIKTRMQKEQSATGTNSMIDLIMGSTGLADMLRRIAGLERITESDQDQIVILNEMKEELEFSKAELERLNAQLEEELADLEYQKEVADELEASYLQLVAEYEQQAAALEAQMRSAQADLDSIKDFVISVNLSSSLNYSSIPSVAGFINPVPAATVSAGTWAYSSGGLHLGLDLAASIGSSLIAPASGLIISSSNTQGSNSGYLGNWSGYPYGSGNFIEMLCEVNGTLYAVSFAHLSNVFYVSAGDTVTQGQILAQTGNSGNSSGPHTHVEVYNLGSMTMEQAVAKFQATGDSAFGTGWGTTSTACDVSGVTPCRERPEKFF